MPSEKKSTELPEVSDTTKKLPGFLINVIFATLFLGVTTPKFKEIFKIALPQLCLGQIMAWGQYVLGLGLSGLLFVKLFGVPEAFGNLLEIGFQGGHGTVGGMTESFLAYKWADGAALGYTVATGGMIIGIVIGMVLVNWALKKGFVKEVRTFAMRNHNERIGVYKKDEQPSAGVQTVFSDSIDSLALHLALVGVSILIGFGLVNGLLGAACEHGAEHSQSQNQSEELQRLFHLSTLLFF